MASILVGQMQKVSKMNTNIHEPVAADYSVFRTRDNTYFQIDTYGSAERKMRGKCSQSIQFDRSSGIALMRLLARELNITLEELIEG